MWWSICFGWYWTTSSLLLLPLISFSTRSLQLVFAGSNLNQQAVGQAAALNIASMAKALLHCHLILLKSWNASRLCILSLPRGYASLLFIVSILIYVLLLPARLDNTTHGWLNVYSLARQPWLVVALNYQSLALSLPYSAVARDTCSRPYLDVTWARGQQVHLQLPPTYCQNGDGTAALSLDIAQRAFYLFLYSFDFNIYVVVPIPPR